jgi:hypothetical protein
MITSTVAFAPAGVSGSWGVDARRYAGVAVPPVVRPATPLSEGTGAPFARRRALALEVGPTFDGAPTALPAQHMTGCAPSTDQPTNDATPLGIHSPGRPSS